MQLAAAGGAREARRRMRAARIESAWQSHGHRIATGEVTLAEILGHNDEKLMQVADIGLGLLKVGKYDSALKVLRGLVLLDPYVPYFHMLLGLLHERTREPERAAAEYDQALAQCEALGSGGHLTLCVLLAKAKLFARIGKLPKALATSQRLRQMGTADWDARLQRELQALHSYLERACGGAGTQGS
jgi:tetratricopeptide (TPR) repeat protein